jgi:hypothetical protein
MQHHFNHQAAEKRSTHTIATSVRIVFAFVFLLLATSVVPLTVRAQCQPGFAGPFTTTMTVTTNCGPTLVKVTYCIPGPTIFPKEHYHIIGVQILSPGAGCQLTGQVMRDIGKQLIEGNPGGFGCTNDCPHLFSSFTVSWGTCWRPLNQDSTLWEPCAIPADQGCADAYAVCCRCDGTLKAFYQGSGASDQCEFTSGCKTMCPGAGVPEPIDCPGGRAAGGGGEGTKKIK